MVQPLGGPRVAYPGEPGAFAEDAVLRFFAAPEAVALSSFRAVFEAVRDGDADAGVVPVESSLLGTIRENLDLLWSFDLPIAGEVSVPVRLALLALPGETLDGVERVYSIAAALAQADEFLRSRPWSVQTTYNTAGAAKEIAERREHGAAAVASARVAGIYGLEVLADDIQSGSDNRTRFAVIARPGEAARVMEAARPGAADGPPRTTLVFAVRNVPGRSTARSGRSRPAGSTCRGSSRGRGPPAGRAGSTCSGSTSTPTRPRPPVRAALEELAAETEVRPDPGHVRAGGRGLTPAAAPAVRSWRQRA